jgi:hypothetical protein
MIRLTTPGLRRTGVLLLSDLCVFDDHVADVYHDIIYAKVSGERVCFCDQSDVLPFSVLILDPIVRSYQECGSGSFFYSSLRPPYRMVRGACYFTLFDQLSL